MFCRVLSLDFLLDQTRLSKSTGHIVVSQFRSRLAVASSKETMKTPSDIECIFPSNSLLLDKFSIFEKTHLVASQELIALVHKTALGMTRLLSTQHHRLGGVTDGWIVERSRESLFFTYNKCL